MSKLNVSKQSKLSMSKLKCEQAKRCEQANVSKLSMSRLKCEQAKCEQA